MYRSYQDWKASQIPEIPIWTEVPEPTKGEVWAADLAEGDVTIFDRLMQVRAQATALLEAQGKDATPAPGNEYFDVELARQELSNMEPHDLEHIEETLNRRILLLAASGEDVEIEEKRLHASLIVLEDEFDQRRLEDEHFDSEEDRLQREGAKLVHPAYQHQLKATYTDEHLTPAQKRIAEQFNTGASTTVADLTSQEPKTIGVRLLEEKLDKLRKEGHGGVKVDLVSVKRYTDADSLGLHLVVHHSPNARNTHVNRVVGLFGINDAYDAIQSFQGTMARIGSETMTAGENFTEVEPELQAYIRASVIPLEWKGMSDDALNKYLFIYRGVVPMDEV